jgi:catechol 2,3-dioxygenase-like lactoylglutathione lyase family enzyme
VKVTELGHVSLFVRDLEASLRFYRDVLGLKDAGRGKGGRIAFLSAGVPGRCTRGRSARARAGPSPSRRSGP